MIISIFTFLDFLLQFTQLNFFASWLGKFQWGL